MNLQQIKEEYVRLNYDGQLLNSLSRKMADEERELEALITSNQKAKEKLVSLVTAKLNSPAYALNYADEKASSLWCNLFISCPELLKGNEEILVSQMYVMDITAPFLNVAKSLLMLDAMIDAYIHDTTYTLVLHVDNVWQVLLHLKKVTPEDYNGFKKKIVQKRG